VVARIGSGNLRTERRVGESLVHIGIIVQTEPDLLEVIAAAHPPSGFAGRLHRGQQQTNHHADNGDHDQQLDERERPPETHQRHREILRFLERTNNNFAGNTDLWAGRGKVLQEAKEDSMS
jgi:hypothetical protein